MSPRVVDLQNNADEVELRIIESDSAYVALLLLVVAAISCATGYYFGTQNAAPQVFFGNDCSIAPLRAGGSR